jgi:hypothetical protein
MNRKVKIKYKHPIKENVELEVVGYIGKTIEDILFVTRIDGYSIDIPISNVISTEELTKQ